MQMIIHNIIMTFLMTSLYIMFNKFNPMYLILLLIYFTLMLTSLNFLLLKDKSMYLFMIFITIISSMLIMFMYFVCLKSNSHHPKDSNIKIFNKMISINLLTLMISTTTSILNILFKKISYNLNNMPNTNHFYYNWNVNMKLSDNLLIYKIYLYPYLLITLILMTILLMTLILSIKISLFNSSNKSLRKIKN